MKATQASAAKPTKARDPAPAAAAPATGPADAPAGDDREACIRRSAYAFFEARGGVHGHELEDWLRAEAEFEAMAAGGSAPLAH